MESDTVCEGRLCLCDLEEERRVFKGERTMIGTRDVGQITWPCRVIGGFFRL